ncbi:MAG TPA: hypothetical protein VJZ71_15360 [Phycisphaerae bacterium]|nr:hypothetical protein [Phycisphaerae bacterium]
MVPWLFVILGLVALTSALYGLIFALRARRSCIWELLEVGLLSVAWFMHHTTIEGWVALVAAFGVEGLRRFRTQRTSATPPVPATEPVIETSPPDIESPPGPPPIASPHPRPVSSPIGRNAAESEPAAPISSAHAMPLPAPVPPPPPAPAIPPLISIALLRSNWHPSPEVFLASLRRGGERGAKLTSSAPIRLNVNDLTLELECAPKPLPRTQINDAAAQSWDWPDAARTVAPHAAHVVFTTRADTGATRDANIRLHCRAQHALAEFAPVIAILWPAAGRLIPAAVLAKLIATPGDFDLAKATCLNFRTFPLEGPEAGRYLCDTVGFSAFGIADLEVECEGQPTPGLTDAIYRRAQETFESEGEINTDGSTFEHGGITWRMERGESRFTPDRNVARWGTRHP